MNTLLDNDITRDTRPYVWELQTYLRTSQRKNTGTTTVPRDGYYGTATADGVREFQADMGMPATGRTDRATWETVFAVYEAIQQAAQPPLPIPGLRSTLLSPGDQGDDVAFLQIMLDALATIYTLPAQSIDSGYNEETEAAVRTLQAISKLPITGYTDKDTWDAVVRLYAEATGGRL